MSGSSLVRGAKPDKIKSDLLISSDFLYAQSGTETIHLLTLLYD